MARVGGDEAFWKFVAALATPESFDSNTDAATFGASRAQTYERLAAQAEAAAGVSKAAGAPRCWLPAPRLAPPE